MLLLVVLVYVLAVVDGDPSFLSFPCPPTLLHDRQSALHRIVLCASGNTIRIEEDA
jgi:hypothetical protein